MYHSDRSSPNCSPGDVYHDAAASHIEVDRTVEVDIAQEVDAFMWALAIDKRRQMLAAVHGGARTLKSVAESLGFSRPDVSKHLVGFENLGLITGCSRGRFRDRKLTSRMKIRLVDGLIHFGITTPNGGIIRISYPTGERILHDPGADDKLPRNGLSATTAAVVDTSREVDAMLWAVSMEKRRRILALLCNGRRTVTDLARELRLTTSEVSTRMREFENLRLTRTRRHKKCHYKELTELVDIASSAETFIRFDITTPRAARIRVSYRPSSSASVVKSW